MAFGPKEVEEERSAEDGGSEDSGPDVVGRNADIVVVVLLSVWVEAGKVVLRIEVIY